ncbi:hybrid sensor histidine kinase/response regulator [Pseudoxanthomonas sp. SGD-10]|nr:hybrid sensor histidine kinase/response regulator [Pseudoxanthomonas sp. SGD-10]
MIVPIKVLLIDDDEDDYILTKHIFSQIPYKEKYTLSWVNNYEEGINAMLKSKFDIYLVDYRLGKYTGIDLLSEAVKSNVNDPIIILTGKGDTSVDQKALEIGAADYLVKDQINPYTVERAIRYTLKHKQSLKALKESEQKFKIIFDKSRDPFLVIDATKEIIDVNYAASFLLDYSIEELKLLSLDALCLKATDGNRFLDRMAETGAVNDFELKLLTKNKDVKTVRCSAFSQIEQHGTRELFYCILHDISDRCHEERIDAIEEITKKIVDEIINPLSNINLAFEQIDSEASVSESRGLYHDILKFNIAKINQVVTDLANAVSDKDLVLKPVNFKELVEEIVDNSNFIGVEIQANVSTNTDINIDLEEINFVFQSLILNAVQAGATMIIINVNEGKGSLIVDISDNGRGIAQEHQRKVFEPFFSGENKGFGFGLTKTRKIVQNHGGWIQIQSKMQKGTSVIFSLPKTQ